MLGGLIKGVGKVLGRGGDLITGGDIASERFDTGDVTVDQGVNPIMEGQRNRANMSEADVQAGLLQGVEQPSREMANQQMPGLATFTGNADLSSALSKRAQRGFESDYARLKKRTEPQAAIQRAKNIDAARQSMEQQRNLDLQNYERRAQAYRAQESIRAGVMANLFGAVGGFAGGAVGGMGKTKAARADNTLGPDEGTFSNTRFDNFDSRGMA